MSTTLVTAASPNCGLKTVLLSAGHRHRSTIPPRNSAVHQHSGEGTHWGDSARRSGQIRMKCSRRLPPPPPLPKVPAQGTYLSEYSAPLRCICCPLGGGPSHSRSPPPSSTPMVQPRPDPLSSCAPPSLLRLFSYLSSSPTPRRPCLSRPPLRIFSSRLSARITALLDHHHHHIDARPAPLPRLRLQPLLLLLSAPLP